MKNFNQGVQVKKKKRTEVNVKKLSPAERKARAKKLEYNNLKTKLVRDGLWENYLYAKKAGEAGRGESLDLMRQMAGEGPVFKKEPAREIPKPAPQPEEAELIHLVKRLSELRAETKTVIDRIAERIGELTK